MAWRTAILTALALLAFAANSVLCRLALKDGLIDALSFTQIRLAAGALVLAPALFIRPAGRTALAWRDLGCASALFVYALAFSWAYVALDAGAGALILFGSVQIAMFGLGALGGARPRSLEWIGLGAAAAGLVWLTAPGLSAPPLLPAFSMAAAGIAWGAYSLLGRGSLDPIAATARNFALTAPLAALLMLAGPAWSAAAPQGVALAIASGAVTSGLGYVIWYAALRGLRPSSAAILQLATPILAALGGVALLGEALSARLAVAAALVLGGVYLALRAGMKKPPGAGAPEG